MIKTNQDVKFSMLCIHDILDDIRKGVLDAPTEYISIKYRELLDEIEADYFAIRLAMTKQEDW